MRIPITLCLALVPFHVSTSSSFATLIQLSDFSSDDTPADVLDATLVLSLIDQQLSLTFTNATSLGDGFEIKEFGFNAADEIQTLTLIDGPEDWTLVFDQTPGGQNSMGPFGRYDAVLEYGGGQSPAIPPGESATFLFDVLGDAYSIDSFIDLSSPPSNNPMTFAAHFFRGPGGDRAWGATNVPEPAMVALLGFGMIHITRRRPRGHL